MTKEVDLLSGDTKIIEKSGGKATPKKEGSSLFDSILSSAKKETTETKSDNTSKNLSSVNKQTSVENKETTPNTSQTDTSKVSKKTTNGNDEVKNEKKSVETKSDTLKEHTSEESAKKSSSSLLDRLVVEAKVSLEKETATKIPANMNNESIKNLKENNLINKKEETQDSLKEENKEEKTVKSQKITIDNSSKELVQKEETLTTKEIKNRENTQTTNDVEKTQNSEKEKINNGKNGIENNLKEISINKEFKNSEIAMDTNKLKNSNKSETEKQTINENDSKISKENISKTSENQISESLKNTTNNKGEKNLHDGNNVLSKNTNKDTSILKEEKVLDKSTMVVKNEGLLDKKEGASKEEKNSVSLKENKILETKNIVNEGKTSSLSSELKTNTTPVKNEQVASELAKLNTQISPEKVVVDDKNLEQNQKQKNSLLDKLIDESKKEVLSKENNETAQNVRTLNEPVKESKNSILTNMYLSTQKKELSQKALEVSHEGKELAKNAKSVEDVKQSAKVLELGLESTKLDVKNVEDKKVLDKTLERLAFVKNVMNDSLQKVEAASAVLRSHQTAAATTQSNSAETVVQIAVAPSLAQNIESRIIGARQQMSTMMSDVAREMYNNYKPPVTAFRINLLPSHLGSISIMMKNDRENGISISMSMSNNATLDAMNESQSTLRNALSKNFSEETSFSLDFGMQNDSSNEGSQKESSSNTQQNSSEEGSLNQNATNEQDNEKSTNYM